MKLELRRHVDPMGIGIEVLLVTLAGSEIATPDEARHAAGVAFDALVAELPGSDAVDPISGNDDVFLHEGHLSVFDGTAVRRVKSIPIVRDAVLRLSGTGALEGAGPPRLSGDVPDGEWLFSLRTRSFRLEASVFSSP